MSDPVFVHPIPEAAARTPGATFQLTGAEAKHTEVKRISDGESLVVTDGTERAIRGLWRSGVIEVVEALDFPSPQPRVTVVQAIPKSERAELAVDLMVQAGADRIIPWAAARSIAKWNGKEEKARVKWENAARAAAKQSRRLRIPEVSPLLRSAKGLGTALGPEPAAGRQILVLHEEAATGIKTLELSGVGEVVLVVGPEGGVSPEEVETFAAAGARNVLLGPEVLRTATAACVALGAIGAMTSRWG